MAFWRNPCLALLIGFLSLSACRCVQAGIATHVFPDPLEFDPLGYPVNNQGSEEGLITFNGTLSVPKIYDGLLTDQTGQERSLYGLVNGESLDSDAAHLEYGQILQALGGDTQTQNYACFIYKVPRNATGKPISWTLKLTAGDRRGALIFDTYPVLIDADTVPPRVTNTTLAPTAVDDRGEPFTVTADVTDDWDTSPNVTVQIIDASGTYDAGGLGPVSGSSIHYKGTAFTHPNPTRDPYVGVVQIVATDFSGNKNIVKIGTIVEGGDLTPPLITHASVTPRFLSVTGGKIRVEATVIDSNDKVRPKVASVQAKILDVNGKPVGSVPMSRVDDFSDMVYGADYQLNPNATGADQTYSVKIMAADLAGNTVTQEAGTVVVTTLPASPSPVALRQILSPASVLGGSTVTATVNLVAPAPVGGEVIVLSSSNTAAVVQPTIIVPAGALSAPFRVITRTVSNRQEIMLYAVNLAHSGVTFLLTVDTATLTAATPLYAVTDLGTFRSKGETYGLNNDGTVIGYPSASGSSFVWRPDARNGVTGQQSDLSFDVTGLNNAGDIVGFDSSSIIVDSRGQVSHIAGYSNIREAAATDTGQIYMLDFTGEAYRYSNTDDLNGDLGHTDGDYFDFVVNSSGQIASVLNNSAFLTLPNGGVESGGISSATELGILAGDDHSYPTGINQSGQVVGASGTTDGSVSHGFFYDGRTMLALSSAPGLPYNVVSGLNDFSQIVGSARPSSISAAVTPLIYNSGVPVDLNTLIPPGSGWVLQNADNVNDCGQICGEGLFNGQPHFFLLTPTLPAARLFVTATISLDGSNHYVARIGVINTAATDARGVHIDIVKLGATQTLSLLPLSLGTISAQGNGTATLLFPASTGAKGTALVLRLSGAYIGGTINDSFRVVLP